MSNLSPATLKFEELSCLACSFTQQTQDQAAPDGRTDADMIYPSAHFQHYIEVHGMPTNRDELFKMWAFALIHTNTMQYLSANLPDALR